MERQTYYVNLNPISMEDISPTKIGDGQLIEYEIFVNDAEYKELQDLLLEVQAHDMELGDLFTFKHFNELETDRDRNETQRGLYDVYRMIHKFGTTETKRAIESLGLPL
ncbi:hypothetical protein [Bacillus alkalicellulosilyticus]|uniref:hypothetical protein n=1 Tax=Alkalihalobacterium alkalicellulosilyticum TaxID=1912214 RepID=UPI000998C691|nr:hypothetical protein [Bacillus alkalicellulosilyticus]